MATQDEVTAAAYAMIPMGMFEFGEACDLARAALEAAERVRMTQQPIVEAADNAGQL